MSRRYVYDTPIELAADITPLQCFELLQQQRPVIVLKMEQVRRKHPFRDASEWAAFCTLERDPEYLAVLIRGTAQHLWEQNG